MSAALHIAPENIRETRILNTYLRKEHRDDKQGISQDEQKRMEYTARLKAQLDHNQMMVEAEERGIKKGRADKQIENIRNMIKNMGVSIEQAMSVLEVPEDERQQYKDLLEQETPKK